MDPTAKNLPAFKMILKRLLVGSSHIFLTRDTFSDALIKVGASLVYLAGDVVRGGSGGSGFFINRNTIVTTYNVLLKLRAPYYIGKEIVVTLYTGAIVIGIISSYDSDRDLCLINIHDSKIEGINITWSKFSSDQPKQGQLVGALGYVNRLIEDIDNPFRDPYTNEDGLIPPNQPRKFPYIQTDL